MIIGLGSDICNIKRIEQAYAKFGERFLQRCFGKQEQQELELLRDRPQRFCRIAGQTLAAKEGFVKAMGTGFAHGVAWSKSKLSIMRADGRCFIFRGRLEEVLEKLFPHPR